MGAKFRRPAWITTISRRMRSVPPGHSVVMILWSPNPAAKASSGIFRSPE